MVWHQYVWEAATGNEVDASDEEHEGGTHQEPLHIDDWIDFNSDELEYLWAILQEYLYDSGRRLFPTMRFEAFARFCHDPSRYMYREGIFDAEYWIDTHTGELEYMWALLKRSKSQFVLRVPYDVFAQFCYACR